MHKNNATEKSCQSHDGKNIHSFLSEWRTKFNIPNSALDELLVGLRERGHSYLPKRSKTLMKTSRHIECSNINDGVYCHTGVERSLFACFTVLKNNQLSLPEKLILEFNVDGINFSRSTNCSLWLIQMKIRGVELDPCVIGTYFGKTKPNCNDFLEYFVDEIRTLIISGFNFEQNLFPIECRFCNDTPANSFIRASKGHAGYYCCMKCKQKGLKLDSCLVFPKIKSGPRTDEDFRERMNPEHHIGDSIIETIPNVNMVKDFAIDEMHVVHHGVVKKLIKFWMATATKTQIDRIQTRISTIDGHRPKEIHRTIRDLQSFNQFKAKEFRTFLLFTGPVILLDILDKKMYDHFMLLHVAMKKLGKKNCLEEIESVRPILQRFVVEFKSIYGLNKITYVVHNLLHLCDDVEYNGSLQSAYQFENNAGKIKRTIKHGKTVAQQIHNRALEHLKVISLTNEKSFELGQKFVHTEEKKDYFRRITLNGVQIDSSDRNQWFLTKNLEICAFKYAEVFTDKKIIINCKKMKQTPQSFYEYPIKSNELEIFFVDDYSSFEDLIICQSNIHLKLFAMPSSKGLVFFPISK